MADRFIHIWNTTEGNMVNRKLVELLGAGTKRDDDETIGMFGSGSLYSPLMALRKKLRYIVNGEDERGLYSLEYRVENRDGFDVVVYDYGEERRDSSFTLDAGGIGWTKPFQLLREPVANAIDAKIQWDAEWDIEVINYPREPRSGYFDVYITANKELIDVVDNIGEYFLDGEPLYTHNRYGAIYKPLDTFLRLYYKGVLVRKDNKVRSLYSYSLNEVELSEEREAKDEWGIKLNIGRMLAVCDNAAILEKIIKNRGDWYEANFDSYIVNVDDEWKETFYRIYGERAVPITDSEAQLSTIMDALKVQNYTPAIVSPFVLKVLKAAGIQDVVELLGKKIEYDVIVPGKAEREVLQRAMDIVLAYEPALDKCGVQVFAARAGQERLMGEATMDENGSLIMLNNEVLRAGLHQTVGTLIHEVDHCISKNEDLSREFRNQADQRLATLMIDSFRERFDYELCQEGIAVPLQFLAKVNDLSYRVVQLGSSIVLDFGSIAYRFKILETFEVSETSGTLNVANNKAIIELPPGITPVWGEQLIQLEV